MNKHEIMKKAVELAKKMQGDWVARMALALKTVWKAVKAMSKKVLPALKGTVKQVKWAEDIRTKVIPVVEEAVQKFVAKLENGEVFAKKDDAYRMAKKEELKAAFDEYTLQEKAEYWINIAITDAFRKGEVVNKNIIIDMFAENHLKLRLKDAFQRMRVSEYTF
jgi:hypothetical protein